MLGIFLNIYLLSCEGKYISVPEIAEYLLEFWSSWTNLFILDWRQWTVYISKIPSLLFYYWKHIFTFGELEISTDIMLVQE